MTTYLCNSIGVSKSGYYNYLKNESKRIEKEIKDKEDFKWIMKAYKFKNRKKGSKINEKVWIKMSNKKSQSI